MGRVFENGEEMTAIFLQGNALDVLKGLPSDLAHAAVTSPPYWGLRAYKGGQEVWDGKPGCEHEWGHIIENPLNHKNSNRGANSCVGKPTREANQQMRNGRPGGSYCQKCGAWRGQLGNEPSPELYIQHLVSICREVKRVLRPDGVLWLNIGDSWSGGNRKSDKPQSFSPNNTRDLPCGERASRMLGGHPTIKPLDMVLIPSLLALALRTDGWHTRSQIVWSKTNPMPESVAGWRWEKHKIKLHSAPGNVRGIEQDAPLSGISSDDGHDHTIWQDCPGCEKCSPHSGLVLKKGSWRPTDSYEVILMLTKTDDYYCDREAVLESGTYPAGESRQGGDGHKSLESGSRTTEGLHNKERVGNGRRNLRSVWSFPTRPFKGSHFATHPPHLVELCLKSSTSEKGCCPMCGAPWARVVERTDHVNRREPAHVPSNCPTKTDSTGWGPLTKSTNVWRPTCSCPASDPVPATVLDPFSGAGTTALVAERMGLNSVSVDTSHEYIAMARQRLIDDESVRMEEFIKKAKAAARPSRRNNRSGGDSPGGGKGNGEVLMT